MPQVTGNPQPEIRNFKTATVLAFDFGEQRIGVAVGDSTLGIAHPIDTIHAERKKVRYAAIDALVQEWEPILFVVGLPAHLDGSEHKISQLARKFAADLQGRYRLPVELIDERLSSAAANIDLAQAGVALKKRGKFIDRAAAQLILQSYFDSTARSAKLT